MPEFIYEDLLPVGADTTEYRLVSKEGVSTFDADGPFSKSHQKQSAI
jgi:fumarate hydratase class I